MSDYSSSYYLSKNRSPSPYLTSSLKTEITSESRYSNILQSPNRNQFFLNKSDHETNYDQNPTNTTYKYSWQKHTDNDQKHSELSDYSYELSSSSLSKPKKQNSLFARNIINEEPTRKSDFSYDLEEKYDDFSLKNEKMKKENQSYIEDSRKFKNIEKFMIEKRYIKSNNIKPIEQVIENIIDEKDSIIESLRQKENELNNLQTLCSQYKKTIENVQSKLNNLVKIQPDQNQIPPEQLIESLLDEKNKEIKVYKRLYSQLKKSCNQNVKKYLIAKGNIKDADQNKTEIELIDQLLKEKDDIILKITNEYSLTKTKLTKGNKTLIKMLENIKINLIQKGKLQEEYQAKKINVIIDKIFSDKEKLADELNSLKEEMKKEREQFNKELIKLKDENENYLQQHKTSKSYQIDNDEAMKDLLISLNQTNSKLQAQIDQIRVQSNEQIQSFKEQIEEQKSLILLLKQEKNELKNKADSKIDDIKNDTKDIIKLLLAKNQTDSNLDIIKNKSEILQLSDAQFQSTENYNKIDETRDFEEKTEEEENEKQINAKRKEILDELILILKIEDDSYQNENSESKYDPVLNKVQELIEKTNNKKVTENPSEDSNNEEYQNQIQLLRNSNNDLQNKINEMDSTITKLKSENVRLTQLKDTSNDLLRRHITVIQTENDKQLRRIKYLQQQEINEILKKNFSKEKKNVKKKEEEDSQDDSEVTEDSESD